MALSARSADVGKPAGQNSGSAQDATRKLEGEQTRPTATFSQLNGFSKLALSDRVVQSAVLLLC